MQLNLQVNATDLLTQTPQVGLHLALFPFRSNWYKLSTSNVWCLVLRKPDTNTCAVIAALSIACLTMFLQLCCHACQQSWQTCLFMELGCIYMGASAGVTSAGVSTGASAVAVSLVAEEVVGASAGPPAGVISAGVTYVVAAQHT